MGSDVAEAAIGQSAVVETASGKVFAAGVATLIIGPFMQLPRPANPNPLGNLTSLDLRWLLDPGADASFNWVRLFHPPEPVIWRGEARTAAVVAIDHRPDADGRLVALTGGEALAALWPMVFRQDAGALELARIGLEGVRTYQLETSRSEQALERALALATELGV